MLWLPILRIWTSLLRPQGHSYVPNRWRGRTWSLRRPALGRCELHRHCIRWWEQGSILCDTSRHESRRNMIASSLVLGINAHRSNSGVPTSVYVTFICIMLLAMSLALLLERPEDLRREDGSAIAIFQHERSLKSSRAFQDSSLIRKLCYWLLVWYQQNFSWFCSQA